MKKGDIIFLIIGVIMIIVSIFVEAGCNAPKKAQETYILTKKGKLMKVDGKNVRIIKEQ